MTKIVRGYCPMGCGESLVLEAARIRCDDFACRNRDAVHEILANPETQHIVRLDESDFSVKHPLRERIEDELFECPVFSKIALMDHPPQEPGTYRVYVDSLNELHFHRITDREDPPHV